MTVFTPLSNDDIQGLLTQHGLTLVHQRPIAEGIENSNFMLEARRANGIPVALVLTVFETLSIEALPWFIRLLQGLAHAGLPVAAPLGGAQALMQVAGKPALLVPKLSGSHMQRPDTSHCASIGALLARLHRQALPEGATAPDPRQQLARLFAGHARCTARRSTCSRRHPDGTLAGRVTAPGALPWRPVPG